ncbi:hypothetical protein INT45_002427 [Circinella minor]|uniref:Coilin tudor domain-containing protein n=1 Tax=Circinella minor TaxID=1195481 RepID=A0A8H7RX95_9FUNG|nr:hypothetical protein INT45_002427 [Circinella minor]
MRIALETLDPLPFYKSWFVFEENDDSTVADLRKALNRSLQLAKKSSHIKLMSGGFEYLPQLKLKNYILNNEVIFVESSKDKPILKTPVVMETQTKKKKEDKKKQAKETKKREKEEKKKKQVEEKKSSQPKEKELKKKRKREEEDEDDKTNVELKEDEPVKKMTKTQKRNLRRKLVIKKRKEQQKQLNQSTVEKETPSSDDEPPTQLSSRKEVSTTPSNDTIKKPSTHLLKKNKNKKANFLKHMDKKQQSHFRFEPSTSDDEEKEQKKVLQDTQEEEHQKQELIDNGSAIVTWNEADENYDGPTKGNVQYPIYNVGNYFHADTPSIPAKKDNESTIETKNMTNKPPLTPKVIEKPDYEKLPSLSFSGPFPEPNDLLAIKLLEMSSSYTPEISDWKQVKVLEFDQEQGMLNVEFQPGFLLKEQTGKFTIRENNGYHDEEEEEEEEEEVEQYLEDQTKQLTQMDIVDMRRL